MANLVSPGYKNKVLLKNLAKIEDKTIEFRGFNNRSQISDGEMRDTLNLTTDNYPVLSPRRPRGEYPLDDSIVKVIQIIARYDRIAMIATDEHENVYFWYDGIKRTAVTGLSTSTKMVAINTKICFFPQNTYIEIIPNGSSYTIGSFGSLSASITLDSDLAVSTSTDARVTLSAGHGLKYDDAINISGTLKYTPAGGSPTTAPVTVSCIIEDVVNTNTIVLPLNTFIEIVGEGATGVALASGSTITREVPSMDHIIEWNNRLWGASNADNTIYACKLGDPCNWQYYQGTSMDSYYAQQGTDGRWTGVGAYSGHIIFFKPNGMCRIYGTSPSNYQVTNAKCFGVEDGSALSVVTINDVIYYKSAIGIMAYAGGNPVCISDNIDGAFANVVAGSEGTKYYCSIQTAGRNGGFSLMVYDIEKGLWIKEDDTHIRGCCVLKNRLYAISYESEYIVCDENVYVDPYLVVGEGNVDSTINIINPVDPTEDYEDIEWMALFGPFHEYLESRKIYSQISLRLKANGTSTVSVYMSLNEGEWEHVKTYTTADTGGEIIPIIPRRCDRYSIKVEGQGNCEVVSLTRRVRQGTFGKL